MLMSGKFLNSTIITFGPEAADEALWKQSGAFMERWMPFQLLKLNCIDPWDHFQDVLQITRYKAYEDFEKCYRGEKEANYQYPHSWLKQIGLNCAIDHSKKEIKDSVVSYFDSDQDLDNISQHSNLHQLIAGIPIEELIYRKKMLKHLCEFIKSFPQKERSILALRLKGYPFKLIALYIGMDPVYARALMWKITRKLRLEVDRLNGGKI
jgi:DNA-directed RNA polymerase specialized sigma24 family protein